MKVLGKSFELLGAVIAISGLMGDEKIKMLDEKIRYLISLIKPIAFLIKFYSSTIRQSKQLFKKLNEIIKSKLMIAVVIIAATPIFFVLLFKYKYWDIALGAIQQSIQDNWGVAIMIVVVNLFFGLIFGFAFANYKSDQHILIKLLIFILTFVLAFATFSILLASIIIIALIAALIFALMGSSAMLIYYPIVLIIFIIGIGWMIVSVLLRLILVCFSALLKFMLFPYELLDGLTVKLNLKSTVLLLGSLITIIGIILD